MTRLQLPNVYLKVQKAIQRCLDVQVRLPVQPGGWGTLLSPREGLWGQRAGIVVTDGGRKRRELASNPHFPGLQRDVASPKSIPHPGSALQLGLLHTSVV